MISRRAHPAARTTWLLVVVIAAGCGDAAPRQSDHLPTPEWRTVANEDVKGVASRMITLASLVPLGQERMLIEALEQFDWGADPAMTRNALLRIAFSSSPLRPAAAALLAQTRDARLYPVVLDALQSEATYDENEVAGILLNLSENLSAVRRDALELLAGGERVARVGHHVLVMTTFHSRSPDTTIADSAAPVRARWEFLGGMSERAILRSALREALVPDARPAESPEPLGRVCRSFLWRMVEQLGAADDVFRRTKTPEAIDAALSPLRDPTLADYKTLLPPVHILL